MAGKRKQIIEPKITKKKCHPRMQKRQIDLRKVKERVKILSLILAEQEAVQVELMDSINILLRQPLSDWNTRRNLYLKCDQLRNVNARAKQLDTAIISDYLDEILRELDA